MRLRPLQGNRRNIYIQIWKKVITFLVEAGIEAVYLDSNLK